MAIFFSSKKKPIFRYQFLFILRLVRPETTTIGKLEPSTFRLYPIYTTDQPLAQKLRMKKIMSKSVEKISFLVTYSSIFFSVLHHIFGVNFMQFDAQITKWIWFLMNSRNNSIVFVHGSLEAILGRTKLSKKTKIGDGSGMVPGVPNKFQSNPVCSFPEQNYQKFVFFQRLSTSRLFLMHVSWSNFIYVFKSFL